METKCRCILCRWGRCKHYLWFIMEINNHQRILNILLIALFLLVRGISACTTFYLSHNDRIIFGNNYDWDLGEGLVIVNKRGVSKTAVNYTNPAQWASKYGSVTFNQYGREFPHGGMNEAGLTVGLMWLNEAEYPPPDSRPEIDNLQWVQYVLDNFGTVEEVIDDDRVRIAPLSTAAIHYLIGDAKGGCVGVEFIGGKRVCYSGDALPVKVLTNSTYASSKRLLLQSKDFGGNRRIPKSTGSNERFVRIAYMIKEYSPQKADDIVSYGFGMLSQVAMGNYTKWSIVYNIEDRCVYFRTNRNKKRKKIVLEKLDFSCKTPVMILDMNAGVSGDITKELIEYAPKKNKKLIRNTFSKTYFLENVPDELLQRVMRLPESFICK